MNATIMRLAFKALVGQRRWFVLVALPVLLTILASVVRALTGEPVSPGLVIIPLGMILVLPLVSLLSANGVLSPEIDDGSVVYLLSTPVSRYAVVISKYLVATLVTAVLGGGGLVLASWVGGLDADWLVAAAAFGVLGSLLYTAVFTALSAATRHGMVAGLIYILILEGLLSTFLVGLRFVSVGSITERLAEAVSEIELPVREMSLTYAGVAAVLIVAAGVAAAGYRLSRFQLRGDE